MVRKFLFIPLSLLCSIVILNCSGPDPELLPEDLVTLSLEKNNELLIKQKFDDVLENNPKLLNLYLTNAPNVKIVDAKSGSIYQEFYPGEDIRLAKKEDTPGRLRLERQTKDGQVVFSGNFDYDKDKKAVVVNLQRKAYLVTLKISSGISPEQINRVVIRVSYLDGKKSRENTYEVTNKYLSSATDSFELPLILNPGKEYRVEASGYFDDEELAFKLLNIKDLNINSYDVILGYYCSVNLAFQYNSKGIDFNNSEFYAYAPVRAKLNVVRPVLNATTFKLDFSLGQTGEFPSQKTIKNLPCDSRFNLATEFLNEEGKTVFTGTSKSIFLVKGGDKKDVTISLSNTRQYVSINPVGELSSTYVVKEIIRNGSGEISEERKVDCKKGSNGKSLKLLLLSKKNYELLVLGKDSHDITSAIGTIPRINAKAESVNVFMTATGNRFTPAINEMLSPRDKTTGAVVLTDGNVIIAGGGVTDVEIFNVSTGQFSTIGNLDFVPRKKVELFEYEKREILLITTDEQDFLVIKTFEIPKKNDSGNTILTKDVNLPFPLITKHLHVFEENSIWTIDNLRKDSNKYFSVIINKDVKKLNLEIDRFRKVKTSAMSYTTKYGVYEVSSEGNGIYYTPLKAYIRKTLDKKGLYMFDIVNSSLHFQGELLAKLPFYTYTYQNLGDMLLLYTDKKITGMNYNKSEIFKVIDKRIPVIIAKLTQSDSWIRSYKTQISSQKNNHRNRISSINTQKVKREHDYKQRISSLQSTIERLNYDTTTKERTIVDYEKSIRIKTRNCKDWNAYTRRKIATIQRKVNRCNSAGGSFDECMNRCPVDCDFTDNAPERPINCHKDPACVRACKRDRDLLSQCISFQKSLQELNNALRIGKKNCDAEIAKFRHAIQLTKNAIAANQIKKNELITVINIEKASFSRDMDTYREQIKFEKLNNQKIISDLNNKIVKRKNTISNDVKSKRNQYFNEEIDKRLRNQQLDFQLKEEKSKVIYSVSGDKISKYQASLSESTTFAQDSLGNIYGFGLGNRGLDVVELSNRLKSFVSMEYGMKVERRGVKILKLNNRRLLLLGGSYGGSDWQTTAEIFTGVL